MAIDDTIQVNISTRPGGADIPGYTIRGDDGGDKRRDRVHNGHNHRIKGHDKGAADKGQKRIAPKIRRVIPDTTGDLEKRRNMGNSRTIFANEQCSFASLGLSQRITKQLETKLGFTQATLVQSLTIPEMISGRDVLSQSQTGSGKTLAFLAPIVDRLTAPGRERITRSQGTLSLIICPTRELCLQTHQVLSKLAQPFPFIVSGIVMGGQKIKSEKASLRKGITILICTPGRLLDHLRHTTSFIYSNCEHFILDEADRLLDLGFENDLNSIADALRSKVSSSHRLQCALLSATLDKRVKRLGTILMKSPTIIDCSSIPSPGSVSSQPAPPTSQYQIPDGLSQGYVAVPERLRLVSLVAFLRLKISSYSGDFKAIVFVSTCDQTEFYHRLFSNICWPPAPSRQVLDDGDRELLSDDVQDDTLHDPIIPSPLFKLHGNMSSTDRTKVYQQYCLGRTGILFCTDVAARGLDLPSVDWIIQYNPPSDITDYVHRIGRTARLGRRGRTLLILSQSERGFTSLLNEHNIHPDEMDCDQLLDSVRREIINGAPAPSSCHYTAMNKQFTYPVDSDTDIKGLASRAFTSYTRSYAAYPKPIRPLLSVHNLHLGHVACSFGLKQAPSSISGQQKIGRRHRKRDGNDDEEDDDDIVPAVRGSLEKYEQGQKRSNKRSKVLYNLMSEFTA
uniref:ATP-dependent RNA helicase n=1 Tax=Spongospora subterranea TaxID=70186 RepID=A0A0H5QN09_9EUKA|eukprot:CRZ02937.1 hypothetical protein [Spongospora subterranea]